MDAYNALTRIQEVFEAESLPDQQAEHPELDTAVELDGASFAWDAAPPEPNNGKAKGKKEPKKEKTGKKKSGVPTNTTPPPAPDFAPGSSQVSTSQEPEATEVFKIRRTNLKIPKGQVIAIVGQVGSGKSSLLQGLIGEMRRETGSVKFCGSVSYCPQSAWIQASPLTACHVMSCLTHQIAERYHPRERLLRSSVRV